MATDKATKMQAVYDGMTESTPATPCCGNNACELSTEFRQQYEGVMPGTLMCIDSCNALMAAGCAA